MRSWTLSNLPRSMRPIPFRKLVLVRQIAVQVATCVVAAVGMYYLVSLGLEPVWLGSRC